MSKKDLTEQEVTETLEAIQNGLKIVENNEKLQEQIKEKFNFETFKTSLLGRSYFPDSQNELMKNSNIGTLNGTIEDVEAALESPASNEYKLIGYNQGFYFKSLMYKRNIEYLNSLPSFDLKISCINAEMKDYNTEAYNKDYNIVKRFFNKFDYRTEFRNILWNMIMSETNYTMFREVDKKFVFQTWPFQYAKITGKFAYGLLYDIDLRYFQQPQVDIDLYPSILKTKFVELFDPLNKNYVPSNPLNDRNGEFATWTQTSPDDGFWCFKFNPNHNLQIPFFSAMLPEMSMLPLLRKLQLNQSIAAARKLLVSSIPYLKEKKGGSVADQIAIDPDILGKFLALATQGLEQTIKVLSLPTEDIKGIEYTNTDEDTYTNFMSVASSLLSGGKVIFAPQEKMNAVQTKLSLELDEMLMEGIYPQFNNFLNYVVNKKTKKFKWNFEFVGCNTTDNRTTRQEKTLKFADKGIVLINEIATSIGLNKIELERELEEAKATNFSDKLSLLLNINTTANPNTENVQNTGRPISDDSDLTDSGSDTRDSGSNIEKGGNI